MHVTLRPATPDDQDFLFQNYAATRADDLPFVGLDERQREFLLKMQFNAQQQSYAASHPQADNDIVLADEQPAGRMMVDRSGDAISFIDIALLPQYRNAGIGTSLIKGLLSEAVAKNLPIRMHVRKANVNALRLYERLGFSVRGDDGMYLRMEFVPARDKE